VNYPGKPSVFRDNPTYRLYQAADGEWLFLACGNQSFWVKLCQVLDMAELAHDPRFASWMLRLDNREVLLPIMEARFRSRPRDAWLEALHAADIPAGPVHTIEEFRRHPLTQHHAMARTYEHPEVGTLTLPASPLLFAQTKTHDVGPAPTLGQHNDYILRELLGLPGETVDRLATMDVLT
jgi:crotonobetainyl-CoA:carnitine CoA-transferase CaiB-like acyl-CoA transferase